MERDFQPLLSCVPVQAVHPPRPMKRVASMPVLARWLRLPYAWKRVKSLFRSQSVLTEVEAGRSCLDRDNCDDIYSFTHRADALRDVYGHGRVPLLE